MTGQANNSLQLQIAQVAIDDMLRRGHICSITIRQVADMLDLAIEPSAYKQLSLLHCIKFDKLPAEVRAAIPSLLHQVFAGDALRFDLRAALAGVAAPAGKKGVLAWLP